MAASYIHSVVTNVPGPTEPIQWAGEDIQEIISFIPQPSPNSLGCAIYTYRSKVSVSVMMDHDDEDEEMGGLYKMGSAQRIADLFEECFGELRSEVEGLEREKKDLLEGGGVGKVKAA
jgi:hypothetical protein